MADAPPPKKKSRFFAAGRSKIGSILRGSQKNNTTSAQPAVEAQADEESIDRPLLEQADRLRAQAAVGPLPAQASDVQAQAQPRSRGGHSLSYHTAARQQLFDLSGPIAQRSQSGRQASGQVGFSKDNVRDAEVGSERQPEDDNEVEDRNVTQSNTSPVSVAAPDVEELIVRDKRRRGIRGPEDLPGYGDSSASTNQATRSQAGISSTRGLKFQGSTQVGPQIVIPAQGQIQQDFTFRATAQFRQAQGQMNEPSQTPVQPTTSYPPIPMVTRFQQVPYGTVWSERGPNQRPHQLSEAQAHQDTGPLGKRNAAATTLKLPRAQAQSANGAPIDPVKRQQFAQRPQPSQTIDLDRDARGQLLSHTSARPIANLPGREITSLPLHATATSSRRRPPGAPDNLYSSPERIEHALAATRIALKRKRAVPILPPPAYIWTRTDDPNFSVFHGILLYPELCLALASHLPLSTLISLYSISRDFHTILDSRFTTMILSQSLRKAPESSRTYNFRSYAHLCRRDPAARIAHPDPILAAQGVKRLIPSFRWLRFVMHREKVVHELMAVFAESGVPLPARCSLAIKRMWFILDIPDNARRIGFIHNQMLFTELDLYFGMCFLVKLDMICNDPVASEKRDGLRKMLLSQMSFTTMLRVLKREMWTKQFDLLQAWVKLKYTAQPDEDNVNTLFGVPKSQWGKLRMEYHGVSSPFSLSALLHKMLTIMFRTHQPNSPNANSNSSSAPTNSLCAKRSAAAFASHATSCAVCCTAISAPTHLTIISRVRTRLGLRTGTSPSTGLMM